MEELCQTVLTGERALFGAQGIRLTDCTFENGESPLKESRDITLEGCLFKWKYPLWYAQDITVKHSVWFEMARAGVWYTDRITAEDCTIDAPKNFRRCHDITLRRVTLPRAAETLWQCDGVTLDQVTATGDYFAMNSKNLTVTGLTLFGNYSFDGVENVTVSHSRLLSKDAFWNSRNVTVTDSLISGEYLGWNAENLTLIRCTVESLQGLCYVDRLTVKDCRLLNTALAFERSTVDAAVSGRVDSVLNPKSGSIRADEIGELILDPAQTDPEGIAVSGQIRRKTASSAEGFAHLYTGGKQA